MNEPPNEPAVEIPVDGTLDLHAFAPREAKSLIVEYLRECRQRAILQVRIVHGKGTGTLQRKVHSILRSIDWVQDFRLADESGGGWGATLVNLLPVPPTSRSPAEKSRD